MCIPMEGFDLMHLSIFTVHRIFDINTFIYNEEEEHCSERLLSQRHFQLIYELRHSIYRAEGVCHSHPHPAQLLSVEAEVCPDEIVPYFEEHLLRGEAREEHEVFHCCLAEHVEVAHKVGGHYLVLEARALRCDLLIHLNDERVERLRHYVPSIVVQKRTFGSLQNDVPRVADEINGIYRHRNHRKGRLKHPLLLRAVEDVDNAALGQNNEEGIVLLMD